jgi:alkylhydroperoxidase family enzyme
VERLVRDYAQLVTARAGIRDQVFDALRKHFTDRQIVELTVRIGLCGL